MVKKLNVFDNLNVLNWVWIEILILFFYILLIELKLNFNNVGLYFVYNLYYLKYDDKLLE